MQVAFRMLAFASLLLIFAASAVVAQPPFAPAVDAQPMQAPTLRPGTGQSGGSPTAPIGAPQQPSPSSKTETPARGPLSSSLQNIASANDLKTELQSIAGRLKDLRLTVNHETSPQVTDALQKLGDALSSSSNKGISVGISPQLAPETSELLSSAVSPLRWLVFLVIGNLSATMLGRFMPWVVRVGNGLRSFAAAGWSAAVKQGMGVPSSSLPNPSPPVSPVDASSTTKPA